jgi:hypothetical protein
LQRRPEFLVGGYERCDYACGDGGHDEVTVNAAPLVTGARLCEVVLAVVDALATIPVVVVHVIATLPLFVLDVVAVVVMIVVVVVAMILGLHAAAQGNCEDGGCDCRKNLVHANLLFYEPGVTVPNTETEYGLAALCHKPNRGILAFLIRT